MRARRLVHRASAGALIVSLLGVFAVATGAAAAGATYTVTRFDDPTPNGCAPGDCSLREAVQAANGSTVADVIRVPAGNYALSIPSPGLADSPAEGDLDIYQDVTIKRIGTGVAMVDAQGSVTGDRAFDIFEGVKANFHGISVKNGLPSKDEDADGYARGGGIRVRPGATLRMSDGSVTASHATGIASSGGGIYVDHASLYLTRMVVAGNRTDFGFGGGIDQILGYVKLTSSVVRANHSGFGGGVTTNGLMKIYNSLFSNNSATALGGAAYATSCGSVSFQNSTVSGNRAPNAAGIRVIDATLFLTFSTVTNNLATGNAGGLLLRAANSCPAEAYLLGSIVAGNHDNNGADAYPDCATEYENGAARPSTTSHGHNLIGDPNDCNYVASTGDQVGTHASPINPKLLPLAFNGGPIRALLSHALAPHSPAVNAAAPYSGSLPQTDERGAPRNLGGRYDIGAYERVACRGVLVNRVGTSGADHWTDPQMAPTTGRDGVLGLGGDDALAGGKGDDGLCGGAGNDQLYGGAGTDQCNGGTGTDHAFGCEVKRQIP